MLLVELADGLGDVVLLGYNSAHLRTHFIDRGIHFADCLLQYGFRRQAFNLLNDGVGSAGNDATNSGADAFFHDRFS